MMSCFSKQDVSFKVLMAQLKSPEELHYSGLSLGDPMMGRGQDPTYAYLRYILRHIGLLEADEDKIRKIRPKGTQVIMLYVPREPIRP